MNHKSGFVNILGFPNVGKSTIMNAMVGEKLSIITSKAQTTRHRIMGIVNGDDFQIVYSDTPGILKPKYKLQESMMNFVDLALTDADIILYATTTGIPVSGLEKFNLDTLLNAIISLLPAGEPYFPKDQLTDKYERFFASEIIREKILLNYQKEIPYCSEVEIESFVEEAELIRIRALIHVTRESQKGIIIGHKGEKLKKTGREARIDMEDFFGKKVFLELYVKVTKDWREKPRELKRFGYRS